MLLLKFHSQLLSLLLSSVTDSLAIDMCYNHNCVTIDIFKLRMCSSTLKYVRCVTVDNTHIINQTHEQEVDK